MPVTITDVCDILRGRVRRIAGKDGQRRLIQVSKAMRVSAPILIGFMNGSSNPTIDTLRQIEAWCDAHENETSEAHYA